MKNPIIAYIGWLLLLSALGFYVYGIYEAIKLSWPKDPGTEIIKYHDVLSTTIGSIQALLLANLGILLGISIAKPHSGLAKQLMLNKTTNKIGMAPDISAPLELREKVQLFALVLYVCSLIACFITWSTNGFSSDSKDVVSLIPESSKMFLGVVLTYLTAVLGKQSS